jgi:phage shock protein PspC (stress-responsive transcriptional regulator)
MVEKLVNEMGDVKEMDGEVLEKRNFIESVKYKLNNFKLMRDTYNQQVAGVCAGLGNYFKIDPVIIRLIFCLIAIYGLLENSKVVTATIAVYVILWVVMPAAKTTVQRLEMKGEVVTLGNIEKELKQSKIKEEGFGSSLASMFESMFNFFSKLIILSFKLGVRLTGLFVIIGGITGLLFTFIGFFTGILTPETMGFALHAADYQQLIEVFPNYATLAILALIAGLSGFTLVVELGIVLLLRKNVIKFLPSALLLGLMVITGALLIVLATQDVYEYRTGKTDNVVEQNTIQR